MYRVAQTLWPDRMVSRSSSVTFFIRGSVTLSAYSGKKEISLSVMRSRPSAWAKPIAQEVKLLLREKS